MHAYNKLLMAKIMIYVHDIIVKPI